MVRGAAWMAAAGLVLGACPLWAASPPVPPTRAERMVDEVSSQVADFLWVKTDDYGHLGHMERAKTLMRMVIQLDPTFVDAYSVLATFSRETEAAGEIYRAGLAANPDDYQLNFEYGYFYHAVWSKNLKAAIPYLRKAAETAPDRARKLRALHSLGHLYRDSGQTASAIATWEEALRLDPSDGVAQRELARLRASRGKS